MREIGVGIIGTGFMGTAHALALVTAARLFDLPARPRLEMVVDPDPARAEAMARRFGFARHATDWRTLVEDPAVDLVSITTPNHLHRPMALAAIAAGKAVWCEKPLAPTTLEALEMTRAAEAAGVPTAVGFNYLRNPLVRFARELIAGGEIGEVWTFRGIHAEDYMADPGTAWSWRLDPAAGGGVVADLGSHILAMARFLVGEIAAVNGDLATVVGSRPETTGSPVRRPVEVDDVARALLRFSSGATGSIEASWVAAGRKMRLAFEVTGSKGTVMLDMERLNELRLFRRGAAAGREGFVEILAGPEHPDYAAFCPAAGHQIGFNDMKAIEARDVIEAVAGGGPFAPGFAEATAVQAAVDAIRRSAAAGGWQRPADILYEAGGGT